MPEKKKVLVPPELLVILSRPGPTRDGWPMIPCKFPLFFFLKKKRLLATQSSLSPLWLGFILFLGMVLNSFAIGTIVLNFQSD